MHLTFAYFALHSVDSQWYFSSRFPDYVIWGCSTSDSNDNDFDFDSMCRCIPHPLHQELCVQLRKRISRWLEGQSRFLISKRFGKFSQTRINSSSMAWYSCFLLVVNAPIEDNNFCNLCFVCFLFCRVVCLVVCVFCFVFSFLYFVGVLYCTFFFSFSFGSSHCEYPTLLLVTLSMKPNTWAISTFSPVSSRSSKLCVCGQNEL